MKFQLSKYIKESFSSSKLYQLAEMAPLNGEKVTIRSWSKILDTIDKEFPDSSKKDIPEEAKKLIEEKIFNNPKIQMSNLKALFNSLHIKANQLYNISDSDFYEYSYGDIKKIGYNNIDIEFSKKIHNTKFANLYSGSFYFWIYDNEIVAVGRRDRLMCIKDYRTIYDIEDYEKLVKYSETPTKGWKYNWFDNVVYRINGLISFNKIVGAPLSKSSNLQKNTDWGDDPSKSKLIVVIIPSDAWVEPIEDQRKKNQLITDKSGKGIMGLGIGRSAYQNWPLRTRNKETDLYSYDHDNRYDQVFKRSNKEYYQKILKTKKRTEFLRKLQPDLDLIYKEYTEYITSTLSDNFDINSLDLVKHNRIENNMKGLADAIKLYNYHVKTNYDIFNNDYIDKDKKNILGFIETLKEIFSK